MCSTNIHIVSKSQNIVLQSVSATSLIVFSDYLRLCLHVKSYDLAERGVTSTQRLRTVHMLRRYWQANTIQNVSAYLYKHTNGWLFYVVSNDGKTFTVTLQVSGNKCRTFHCIKVTNVYVTWLGEDLWKNNMGFPKCKEEQGVCTPDIL